MDQGLCGSWRVANHLSRGSYGCVVQKICPGLAPAAASHQPVLPVVADDVPALVKQITDRGMKAAIAVKPGTPIDSVLPYCEQLNMVLVMTVEPGFGGQSFMPDMMPKVQALRKAHPNLNIQVDGGIGPKNIEIVAQAGANVIVAGTSVFKAPDPAQAIADMRHAVDKAVASRA